MSDKVDERITLQHLIRTVPLPESLAAKFVFQILCELRTFHKTGKIHGRLNAEQVAVLSDSLKPIELIPSVPNNRIMVQSPYWFSPEYVRTQKYSSSRCMEPRDYRD